MVERLRKVGALCEKSVHVLTGGNVLRNHEDRALDDAVKDLRILIAPPSPSHVMFSVPIRIVALIADETIVHDGGALALVTVTPTMSPSRHVTETSPISAASR